VAAPATLASAEGHDLYAWCAKCLTGAWLDRQALVARLGPDAAIPDVARKLRCTRCGTTGRSGITLHHAGPGPARR
jgi:hypothetical protein